MELDFAVRRLSALAHENRLAIFRLLVSAGSDGISAGKIARELGIAANTLSAQLNALTNAGLITARRNGRSIIYTAAFDVMRDLLVYLLEDCCQGRPEICLPVMQISSCQPSDDEIKARCAKS